NVVCSSLITSFNGLTHTLDRGAHHRAKACVVLVTCDRLASAFTGLGSIGHVACSFKEGLIGKDRHSKLFRPSRKVGRPKAAYCEGCEVRDYDAKQHAGQIERPSAGVRAQSDPVKVAIDCHQDACHDYLGRYGPQKEAG